MTTAQFNSSIRQSLLHARQVADYATSLGLEDVKQTNRTTSDHLGAVLADSVLQAGVNYRTVVMPRIDRIVRFFPETSNLVGTVHLIDTNLVPHFLLWKHSEKIGRFIRLVEFLQKLEINDTRELRIWLETPECCEDLLKVPGVGPKTVDYLSSLVGIDSIAIDRHIKAFVNDAGIINGDYNFLKIIVSYAADLLGIARRDFDAWIWNLKSAKLKQRCASTCVV